MIKAGTVVHFTDDADEAREFCRTRGLTAETARIVKRNDRIEVEIKAPCKLKVQS